MLASARSDAQTLSIAPNMPMPWGPLTAPATASAAFNATGEVGHWETGAPFWTATGQTPNPRGFNGPCSVAIDTVHHWLFVLDISRVLAFALDGSNQNPASVASFVIGQVDLYTNVSVATSPTQSTFAVSGSGASGSVNGGIAVDNVHSRLFVSDYINNRILVFSTASISNGMNASNVLGQTTFTARVAATTATGLNGPLGMAYDGTNDRLFVTDYNNNRVLVYSTATITDGMAAGHVLGQANFTSAGNALTQAGLNGPQCVAYDNTNHRLFVGDLNNFRVVDYDVATGTIADGSNALNVLGQTNFTTAATSGSSANRIRFPAGLAYDETGGWLYTSDANANKQRVLAFNVTPGTIADNMSASNALGQPDPVSGNNHTQPSDVSSTSFNVPQGMIYENTNRYLYVIDNQYHRVLQFITTNAGVTDAQAPNTMAGHVNPTGTLKYTAFDTFNWPNSQSAFNTNGAALDTKNHRLFVTDYDNATYNSGLAARVLVFALDANNNITTGTAANVIGWPDFWGFTTGTAAQNRFNTHTSGIVYDTAHDRLFVCDTNNNRVLVFDGTAIADGMNATNVLGQSLFTNSGAAVTSVGMDHPRGLEYDSTNNRLFVVDTGNNRVLVFDVSSITDGKAAAHVFGQADFTHKTAGTTQSTLSGPNGNPGWDSVGKRLFVCDATNNRVLAFNADPATIADGSNALNVLGQSLFTTATAATSANGFRFSDGSFGGTVGAVLFDSTWSRLFVMDSGNYRVMLFEPTVAAISNGMNASNILAQPSLSNGTLRTTAQNGNGYPRSSGFDVSHNRLFLCWWLPDRVDQIDMINITKLTMAAGSTGVAYSQTVTVTQTNGSFQRFTLVSGALPTGLTLNLLTGVVSGTPTVAAAYSFTIQATDYFATGTFWDRVAYSVTIS